MESLNLKMNPFVFGPAKYSTENGNLYDIHKELPNSSEVIATLIKLDGKEISNGVKKTYKINYPV